MSKIITMKAGKVSPWLVYDEDSYSFGNLCADGVREVVDVPMEAKAIRLHTVAKMGKNTVVIKRDGWSYADGHSFDDYALWEFFSELHKKYEECPTCGNKVEVEREALVEVEWR